MFRSSEKRSWSTPSNRSKTSKISSLPCTVLYYRTTGTVSLRQSLRPFKHALVYIICDCACLHRGMWPSATRKWAAALAWVMLANLKSHTSRPPQRATLNHKQRWPWNGKHGEVRASDREESLYLSRSKWKKKSLSCWQRIRRQACT